MARRVLIALAVSVTAMLAVMAQASGATLPRAQLTALACSSPTVPARRAVSIETVMRPVAGTRSLSLRLTLLQGDAGAAMQTVPRSGDLGIWLTPAETTLGRRAGDVWKLAKTVYDVAAPARYRFSVQFRWRGAGGRVLRRVTLRSRACTVTDPRPDLLVRSVAVTPVGRTGTRDRYVALIANRGASAAGPFAVQFTATTGAAAQLRQIASLAPGANVRVAFTGPACDSAAPPVVVVDPDDRVDDANRANNAASVACPDT